jgi:hypothetical protein
VVIAPNWQPLRIDYGSSHTSFGSKLLERLCRRQVMISNVNNAVGAMAIFLKAHIGISEQSRNPGG